MRYGISAASLIVENERLLLVHHLEEGKYDFWVPPGGSVKGSESVFECARRETLEETGLQVELGSILYIQEFYDTEYHFIKFFILASGASGELSLSNRDADESFLVEARWFTCGELQGMNIFPLPLKDQFWVERCAQPVTARYLGLEEMRF